LRKLLAKLSYWCRSYVRPSDYPFCFCNPASFRVVVQILDIILFHRLPPGVSHVQSTLQLPGIAQPPGVHVIQLPGIIHATLVLCMQPLCSFLVSMAQWHSASWYHACNPCIVRGSFLVSMAFSFQISRMLPVQWMVKRSLLTSEAVCQGWLQWWRLWRWWWLLVAVQPHKGVPMTLQDAWWHQGDALHASDTIPIFASTRETSASYDHQ
jgi:hypothetical protein